MSRTEDTTGVFFHINTSEETRQIIQFYNRSSYSTNCAVCFKRRKLTTYITMSFKMNTVFVFAMVFCIQALNSVLAKPFPPGCGCDGFEGGFPTGREFGCGPISPPISFLPVPQPVPVRVPQPQRQSVTIPNIILALLPPNQKPPCAPRPVIRPPPVVLPLPQPYPLPISGERCGCY